jgi:hypothetical protein
MAYINIEHRCCFKITAVSRYSLKHGGGGQKVSTTEIVLERYIKR